MFGLGKRRRQVEEHSGPVDPWPESVIAIRRERDRARAERDEATRELRAAGNARANFFEALFAGAPGVADMEGTSEQVALWYVRELRRQLAEASADLVAAAAFEAALSLHMPESWDGEEAFTAIADDFVRTVTERLIALGGSLEKHPEEEARRWPQDRAADVTYSGSSKVQATYHDPDGPR